MTPVLLLPLGLAALAALLLPLVIHLARKTEQRPTDFAALRWLREKPRPRHRPRLDEWPLLIARLLLLALLALWLARPAVFGADDETPVVAVAPGVDPARIPREGVRGVWLAPGFPDLTTSPPTAAPVASLIRQLDADLPRGARLRVVVPAILQGADAERPHLSRAVDWQIVPGAMPPRASTRPTAPAIAVHGGSRYITAAIRAWSITPQPLRADTSALVWLDPGPLPATARAVLDRGGTVLAAAATEVGNGTPVWRDAIGQPLVEDVATPRGRLLRFTRALVPAAMPELLEPDFPAHLRALVAIETPPPERVGARDYAPTKGATPYPQPAIDLRPWLAIIIAALFLIERLLATRSRRAVAP